MARVFSGIQPTGRKHVGNLIGAIRHWVADQDRPGCVYCIVDLHSVTVPRDPAELRDSTVDTAALLLAAGIDPERSTFFLQSHVHEHAELGWLLNCVATMGELGRMVQFKEKSKGQESVLVGLFDYPVLQAADVLLYGAERVPVGEDQRQHLELMRDVAIRFNGRFGETFVVPEASIPQVGARIVDLQQPERKMSTTGTSDAGTLFLLDPPATLRKKVMSAVTDSGSDVRADPSKPGVTGLLQLLSALTDTEVQALEDRYAGSGYGTLKKDVAEAVIATAEPLQRRHAELVADQGELRRILRQGADRAREQAAPTLERARAAMGFVPPR